MALMKLEDFYPNHDDENSIRDDIKNFDVYSGDDKVGSVEHILVDENTGKFRYFVVDTGFWIFGKKVLLPVGLATPSYTDRRVYINGLSKQQVEDLPKFSDLEKIDYEHEEQVRDVYRPMTAGTTGVTTTDTAAAGVAAVDTPAYDETAYDRNTYSYDRDPALYNLGRPEQETLRLYEERLIANKQRQKTGEVIVGKRVETNTARVAVPIEKERVVVERVTPADANAVVDPAEAFGSQEAVRMEVYEETPDIRKEAVVREEVRVKKVAEQETVDVQDEVRREELDADTKGNTRIERS